MTENTNLKLIVGLGNPGSEYTGTRHNVGFEVIELLAERHSIACKKRNCKSVYGEGIISGERVILARPMTFMNLSGEAVQALIRYFKINIENIIIILDEIALPSGKLRLRFQGSAGGHNGLSSVLIHLHTQSVARIRIGVGAPRTGQMVSHVLSRFSKEDIPVMQEAYALAADASECAVKDGFELAMNRFNLRDKPAEEQTKSE